MTQEIQKQFTLDNEKEIRVLLGNCDENVRILSKELNVKIVVRGNILLVNGVRKHVKEFEQVFAELVLIIKGGSELRKHDLEYCIQLIKGKKKQEIAPHDIYLEKIEVSKKKKHITPKTAGQKQYVDTIKDNDIVFAIGPAGTGKTYLAMACAVCALLRQEVSRIVLARPAVEAGENLGFLPGDLKEKIDPYLRPIYDALYDMMEMDLIEKYTQMGVIEIAPLAFMRGRTLNDAFIILDEAQNCTPEQMKMFLTRIGFDSKAVITGDITQVDLPKGKTSGLIEIQSIIQNIKGIEFVYFSGIDVVRHELVQKIIHAYEKFSLKKE